MLHAPPDDRACPAYRPNQYMPRRYSCIQKALDRSKNARGGEAACPSQRSSFRSEASTDQASAGSAEPQVGRPEVVPQLPPDSSVFRCGEDDQAVAAFELRERGTTVSLTQSAAEDDDVNAVAPERAFLVGHEGNECETTIVGRSRMIAGTW
jgi:hypothetical protein